MSEMSDEVNALAAKAEQVRAQGYRGATFEAPGQWEIQDTEGTLESGDKDEMWARWMEYVEGREGCPRRTDHIKLVEIKAVIRDPQW